MNNKFKLGIGIAALVGLILLGLFAPSEEKIQEDLFVPGPIPGMLSSFGEPKLQVELIDIVDIKTVESSREEIRSGKFRYLKNSLPWTFSAPIDWSKSPSSPEDLLALQSLFIADPFLQSYAESENVDDFRQAVFFMLDWQSFYQTKRQVTPLAWEESVALARVQRLAYVLARIERNTDLLNEDGTRALIRLADFHIQRMTDKEYGSSQDNILQSEAFQALCDTLDDLQTCPR